MSNCFPFCFSHNRSADSRPGGEGKDGDAQSLKSYAHNVVCQRDINGVNQLVRLTASALRFLWDTFTSETAVTLKHNGPLIKGSGKSQRCFQHKLRLGNVFGRASNNADKKRGAGCRNKMQPMHLYAWGWIRFECGFQQAQLEKCFHLKLKCTVYKVH